MSLGAVSSSQVSDMHTPARSRPHAVTTALARVSELGEACESMRQGLAVADLLGLAPAEGDSGGKRASGSSRPSTAGNPRRGRNRPATLEEILQAISAGEDGEGSSASGQQQSKADAQAHDGEAEQRDDHAEPSASHEAELDASMRDADDLVATAGGSVNGEAAEQEQRMLLEPPALEDEQAKAQQPQQQQQDEQRRVGDATQHSELQAAGDLAAVAGMEPDAPDTAGQLEAPEALARASDGTHGEPQQHGMAEYGAQAGAM